MGMELGVQGLETLLSMLVLLNFSLPKPGTIQLNHRRYASLNPKP